MSNSFSKISGAVAMRLYQFFISGGNVTLYNNSENDPYQMK